MESIRRGKLVYRKHQDSNDRYTDGIVHKVIYENGVITRIQVSFWRKDRTKGFINRTMYVDDLTMTEPT